MDFSHENQGGILICNRCGRIWHVSDYSFACPDCGKLWEGWEESWNNAKYADMVQDTCTPLSKMVSICMSVKNVIGG